MDNVTYFVDTLDGVEFATITYADGSFTSMLKSTYDEQQAAQAMPQPMPEEVQIMPEEVEILPEEVQAEPVIPEA